MLVGHYIEFIPIHYNTCHIALGRNTVSWWIAADEYGLAE